MVQAVPHLCVVTGLLSPIMVFHFFKWEREMFGLGPMEMAVVGIVALLLFGSCLPKRARSLGQSINAFKEGLNQTDS